MRRTAVLLAALAVGGGSVEGCGSSQTTPRNEADWAEAKQKAKEQVEPEEALLGASSSREREQELAKAEYNTIVARERATPTEKAEAEEEAG